MPGSGVVVAQGAGSLWTATSAVDDAATALQNFTSPSDVMLAAVADAPGFQFAVCNMTACIGSDTAWGFSSDIRCKLPDLSP